MNRNFNFFLESFLKEFLFFKNDTQCLHQAEQVSQLIVNSLVDNSLIAICGNGGSMADAMHFSAELTVRFKEDRRPINSIALSVDPVFNSACANDFGFETIFARNIESICKPNDIVICITTSGRSENILRALDMAKKVHCKTVVLCGSNCEYVKDLADYIISVPSSSTATIQSMHKLVYHWICEDIELRLLNA